MAKPTKRKSWHDFYKLKRHERISKLVEMGSLTQKEAEHFYRSKAPSFTLAENFIENSIGYYQIPLGVAVNFYIDRRDYVIPMAVEETSVIAAASKTAKWIREHGEIITKTSGSCAIGQVQLAKIKNFDSFQKIIMKHKNTLIKDINLNVGGNMLKRGGGVKKIIVRKLPRNDGGEMAVIHIMVETCDAMGANFVNQICEYLRSPIEALTNEKVNLCILSNLIDSKLTQAKVIIHDLDFKLGKAIEEASLFAQCDPYRAATSNKGILNGMDAVAIATGNDWRAVEAGVHSYAARDRKYVSIAQWTMQNSTLIGELQAPINVGIVGGMTRLHPTANLCLKMLGIKKAEELSRIIAAVGLVQNLGALRALTTEGICKGHMKLHIANLCLAAGAKSTEIKKLKQFLENTLQKNKRISLTDAVKALKELRC